MEAEKLKNGLKKSSPSESEEEEEAKTPPEDFDEDGVENSTELENTKISLMRAFVESKDPSAKVPFPLRF